MIQGCADDISVKNVDFFTNWSRRPLAAPELLRKGEARGSAFSGTAGLPFICRGQRRSPDLFPSCFCSDHSAACHGTGGGGNGRQKETGGKAGQEGRLSNGGSIYGNLKTGTGTGSHHLADHRPERTENARLQGLSDRHHLRGGCCDRLQAHGHSSRCNRNRGRYLHGSVAYSAGHHCGPVRVRSRTGDRSYGQDQGYADERFR